LFRFFSYKNSVQSLLLQYAGKREEFSVDFKSTV
jgi:hypothetical protein